METDTQITLDKDPQPPTCTWKSIEIQRESLSTAQVFITDVDKCLFVTFNSNRDICNTIF